MTWTGTAPALATLAPENRAALDRLAPFAAPRGTVLFRPGDSVEGFVIVLSGRIDVFLTGPTGRDILLYAVEPGQSCIQSTLGLLGGDDYSGEAVTRSDCRLVLIPRGVFLSLMGRDEGFRTFVFHAFAQRMQSMMHLLEKVAFQRIECRLAETLLQRAENGVLHATHAEIATMIGSAREVVSRRLDAFSRRGIVALERGNVRLLDEATLRGIADTGG
ncbi:MAG: Crp/Fnr family transcriptional regulator [Rhodobacteraceae bacterium]|jgi:CRP/FNR family transcriptional regulator|uniref:CRP/FNR family transcriptional regulator, anaerobic regulatory protein n=1 Tax=Salipiger profundus TaxID=1229727 RepID=A0A1U7D8F3_9RHOB|nr:MULTISPECIES: Crp/Fnr family transcriptional regulator [Salipiger]APX24345.1 CRP/FNR family transcriptional regulator, anaerobic regulatory protein [Salipiger profundus]MAB06649.1 Crp/Fnr family transcriptional regulator [Paracoccaceae bacterium]GFZ96110.1 Crp/Fnr family transcriptional regulator [Salipiger profundus]SFB83249.1 CRP/FNR family transcriptional regulator, anaerobic regulatory protein [Salipiger profundus]